MSPLQGFINKLASLPVAMPQAITSRPFGAFSNNFSDCFAYHSSVRVSTP
jgi:hypothetical protein